MKKFGPGLSFLIMGVNSAFWIHLRYFRYSKEFLRRFLKYPEDTGFFMRFSFSEMWGSERYFSKSSIILSRYPVLLHQTARIPNPKYFSKKFRSLSITFCFFCSLPPTRLSIKTQQTRINNIHTNPHRTPNSNKLRKTAEKPHPHLSVLQYFIPIHHQ